MAAKKVTASFTVTFTTSETDGILKAEVDDRDPADGGLNAKTSFAPGDPVVYLIFKGEGVTVNSQLHSYGSHVSLSSGISVTKEETKTFYGPDQLSQDLDYPVSSITSWEWIGDSSLGTPKFNDQTITVTLPTGTTYAVGVLKVTYISKADAYRLTHAPLGIPEYEIATLVVGTYVPPTL